MADRRDDERLIAAFRAGNDAAFDVIYERYHGAMLRYARKVLGGNGQHAEDVVQEAMWRTSRALRRDDRHIELRPWLYRLVRNSALDELSRVRTDSIALDDDEEHTELRAAPSTEPEQAAEGRRKVRDVLGDIAALPESQRHALLRREVDGLSHAALARELGTTEQATKNLVLRARTNLVKAEEARGVDHEEVRCDLLRAHDEGRRASAATYRHLATCADCRAFRAGLKDTRRAVAILVPGPLLLLALGLFTGKAAAATATKAAAVKATGVVTTGAVVTAGTLGIGVQVFQAGDPAPQSVDSPALVQPVEQGRPLPEGTAVVRGTVTLRPGTTAHPAAVLDCPPGLRVADLLRPGGTRLSVSYAPDTIVGASTRARVLFDAREVPRAQRVRVSVLCKRPDREGSVVAGGRGGDGARAASTAATVTVAVPHAYLHVTPDGPVRGSVRRGQPLTPAGAPRGGWQRVVTDQGVGGWVERSALAERP